MSTLAHGFDVGYGRVFLALKDRVDLLEGPAFRLDPEDGLST